MALLPWQGIIRNLLYHSRVMSGIALIFKIYDHLSDSGARRWMGIAYFTTEQRSHGIERFFRSGQLYAILLCYLLGMLA
jgi:hypothetical protein